MNGRRGFLVPLLVAISCSPTLATAAAPPAVGVPELVGRMEAGPVPMTLESAEIEVRIHDFLAETTLVLSYFNDDPRDLEGEFLIRLPEGATVGGYGLDVDGVLVDGVVVEKQKARIAFDRETHLAIDPGLVEWLGGDLFRTRVYPIPGKGRRTVKFQWVSRLSYERRQLIYRLPIAAYPELESFGLRVEVVEPERRPEARLVPSSDWEWSRSHDSYVLEATASDFDPNQDLELRLEAWSPVRVAVEETVDGDFAFAIADYEGPEQVRASALREPPDRIAVLWDASFSRHREDTAVAVGAVARLLETWRPSHVELVVFRNEAEGVWEFPVVEGESPPLVAALSEQVFDGATGWEELGLPPESRAEAVLLVTDGRITFGREGLPNLDLPIYVFDPSVDGNRGFLRYLAESSGGAYFHLPSLSSSEMVEDLRRTPARLEAVSVTSGKVWDIEAPSGRPVRSPVLVSGRFAAAASGVEIVYSRPDGSVRRVPVALEARQGALVERFWAQQRLERLALFPSENRQTLLRLGRRYGLVTPVTSLLVLETLDQYLAYQIEPPESRPEMREEYREEMDYYRDELTEVRDAYLEDLQRGWEAYIEWSQAAFPISPVPTPPGELSETPRDGDAAGVEAPSSPPPLSESGSPSSGSIPGPSSEGPESVGDPLADRPTTPQTVRGVVRDDAGYPLPGARVVLESSALVEPLELITDVDGAYQTPVLIPGGYRVTGSLESFSPQTSEVWVGLGAAPRADFQLSTGFAEAIMVTAEPAAASAGSVSEILVQPWSPEAPYLDRMQEVSADEAYRIYLQERLTYGASPAFFVDCALHFYERGARREARLIASNLLELGVEDSRLIRAAASLFFEAGDGASAVTLFEHLLRLRPELPQSSRDLALALALRARSQEADDPEAARRDYRRGADLLRSLVFEPWGDVDPVFLEAYLDDDRFQEIGRIALVEYNWILGRLSRLPGPSPEEPADPAWLTEVEADLRIVLTWQDEYADMDLWVVEPNGNKVFYSSSRSAIGGLLSEDNTAGLGPESYTLRQAPPGRYRILVDYFADSGPELLGPVMVQTTITTGFGREDETTKVRNIRLQEVEDTVEIGEVIVE